VGFVLPPLRGSVQFGSLQNPGLVVFGSGAVARLPGVLVSLQISRFPTPAVQQNCI